MKTRKNREFLTVPRGKKGILFSDIVMTTMFLGFVALAVIAVVVVSTLHVDQKNEALQEEKSGYATAQLLRTFSQTPLIIEGQEATVSHYLNEYFSLTDSKARKDALRRTTLRDALRELARETVQPHLKFPDKGYSYLEVSLWRFDRKVDEIELTSTKRTKQKNIQEDKVVYIGFFQQPSSVQLPTYFSGSTLPPGDEYILITINETNP